VPIVGNDETLVDWRADGVAAVVITVAAWRVRKRLFAQASALGFELPALIHPTAYLAAKVRVGAGSIVYPGVVVMPGCQLDQGVLVNAGVTLGHEVIAAGFCNINPGANVAGRVTLGEGVLVGIGSVVLEGRCIGEGARVGAGAVVTKDIAANTTVIGIPARPIEFTQPEDQP
jgi:sugar O-acyltransferase (sialic acid O-acetyltransferase NeuD family)